MKKFIVALLAIAVLSLNVDANAAGRVSSAGKAPAAKAHVASTGQAKADHANTGFFSSAFGSGHASKPATKPAAKAAGTRSAWAK